MATPTTTTCWSTARSGERITGLIDFGDAIHSATIGELAVAAAYAILDQEAPIEVAGSIAAAYPPGLSAASRTSSTCCST